MDWPKARQLRAFDKYADEAFDLMEKELTANRDGIKARARKRMSGQGFDEYQDRTFRLDADTRCYERFDEHADALVYKVIDLAVEGGVE
jgi:hypothetical protein